MKLRKVALIHDKDTYGQGLVNALRATMKEMGVEPVLFEGLTRGERDFNALVTKIRSSDADAVYFGGLIPEAGPLIRQLHEQDVNVTFVSGDALAQTEIVAAAGGLANLGNVYYSSAADPLKDPATAGVQDSLEAAGIKPTNFALLGYASVQAVVAAFKGTRDGDVKAQVEWLRRNSVPTAVGQLSWTAKGDLKEFKYVFYRFDAKGTPFPAS